MYWYVFVVQPTPLHPFIPFREINLPPRSLADFRSSLIFLNNVVNCPSRRQMEQVTCPTIMLSSRGSGKNGTRVGSATTTAPCNLLRARLHVLDEKLERRATHEAISTIAGCQPAVVQTELEKINHESAARVVSGTCAGKKCHFTEA